MAAVRNGVVKFSSLFPRFPCVPVVFQKRGAYIGQPVKETVIEPRQYEVSRDPQEWEYVRRLFGRQTVPSYQNKEEYPSGWKPPNKELAKSQPYFVERSKNHMLSLYLNNEDRGQLKITAIKRIHGDIWQLHTDVTNYVKEKIGRKVPSQVLEVNSIIKLKGDYYHWVEEFLLSKGF